MMTVDDYTDLGIEEIDAQHRELIALIGKLHQAVAHRDTLGGREVEASFNAFIAHAVAHFAAEEKMMSDAHYPDFAHHKKEHTALLRAVNHHYEDYLAGAVDLGASIEQFLEGWLADHTTQSDIRYVPYLKK